MARLGPQVRIVEVGPRDGLQSIKDAISTETKVKLIQRLHKAGLRTIELTSVVSPHKVPQLADCQQVLAHPVTKGLLADEPRGDLRLPVLVPNIRGLDVALSHGVKEVAVFTSATEGFSKANINSTVQQGIEKARKVARKAIDAGLSVRGYVSCIFVDPYIGPTEPSSVLRCAKELLEMGCYEVSLGDTTGAGTPAKVASLIRYLERGGIPLERLAGHFHDTHGQGTVNVLQAYLCGIRVFDSSAGGLGGCPFAPGAKGNVSTEDLVFMFHNAGITTGVNLAELVDTGKWIAEQLRQPGSRSSKSMKKVQPKGRELWLPTIRSMLYTKQPGPNINPAKNIHAHQDGSTVKIVLNRPRAGNALTKLMISELIDRFKAYDSDPGISRIILTGTGAYFCAGLDIPKKGRFTTDKPHFDELMQLFETIDQSRKIVIACLNGHACGAGAALALVCHRRIMIKGATIELGETRRKIFPGLGYTGFGGGKDASIFSARPINGSELKILGLVGEVADGHEDLQTKLETYMNGHGGSERLTVSATKQPSRDGNGGC